MNQFKSYYMFFFLSSVDTLCGILVMKLLRIRTTSVWNYRVCVLNIQISIFKHNFWFKELSKMIFIHIQKTKRDKKQQQQQKTELYSQLIRRSRLSFYHSSVWFSFRKTERFLYKTIAACLFGDNSISRRARHTYSS